MCGQWVRPVREWDAPRSLQNFPAAGDAPIYVGFGSMVGFDQRALLNVVIAAVAGQRALFFPGWSSADSVKLPPKFLCHWRYPARLALPAHVLGHSSRRVWDHAFCGPCRCAFGRSTFRSRSVLLGRAVTPERHRPRLGKRPEGYDPHLVSRDRCRPNGRDAGAGFGRRRNDALQKTAWQRLSTEFTSSWLTNSRLRGWTMFHERSPFTVHGSRFTVGGWRLAVGGWRLNRRRSRIKDFLICVNWSSSAVEDRCRKIEPRMNPRSGRAATNGMRDPASPQAGSRLRRRKPGGLSRAFRRNQEPWRCFKSFL
jgi:hypothetical protein